MGFLLAAADVRAAPAAAAAVREVVAAAAAAAVAVAVATAPAATSGVEAVESVVAAMSDTDDESLLPVSWARAAVPPAFVKNAGDRRTTGA